MKKIIYFSFCYLIAFCVILFFSLETLKEKSAIGYMARYMSAEASMVEYRTAKRYGLDWVRCFAVTMGESGGKQMASSHTGDKGYKQLAPITSRYLRERLSETIKDTDVYATEFNITGGNIVLRSLLDLYKDWYIAIEVYNVGIGNYRRGIRNSGYLKKYILNETFFRSEYKSYWSFGIL